MLTITVFSFVCFTGFFYKINTALLSITNFFSKNRKQSWTIFGTLYCSTSHITGRNSDVVAFFICKSLWMKAPAKCINVNTEGCQFLMRLSFHRLVPETLKPKGNISSHQAPICYSQRLWGNYIALMTAIMTKICHLFTREACISAEFLASKLGIKSTHLAQRLLTSLSETLPPAYWFSHMFQNIGITCLCFPLRVKGATGHGWFGERCDCSLFSR